MPKHHTAMAQKILKTKKRKVAPKKAAAKAERKIVLVGTYREGQLAWIEKNRRYNYPVREGDKFDAKALGKVSELWLYAGTKGKRHCYEAKFLRQMTREEWLKENPTYGKKVKSRGQEEKVKVKGEGEQRNDNPLNSSGTNKAYYVFEVKPLDYGTRFDAPEVITRVADFGGRSAKIKKAIEQYEKDGEFAPLAAYLPTELAQVPKEQLRVCEPWVQMDLIARIEDETYIKHLSKVGYTAVELFAGAGGLSIGLEKAGIHVVIANEIMPDFAATLVRNHPRTKVINEDIHKIDFTEELSKLGLNSVDVLSGGPPCQGFSTIGSKNRKDPRNSLFYEYLRAVAETHPKYTIFENVSGFKRLYDGFAYKTLVKELDELGYETNCQILNAADYGAPQIRYRTIVLGWRKGLAPLDFPKATHGTEPGRSPYVSLIDAIGDLPPLNAGGCATRYTQPPMTDYQRKMRGSQTELRDHNAANYGVKMQEILRIIPEGGEGLSVKAVEESNQQRYREVA